MSIEKSAIFSSADSTASYLMGGSPVFFLFIPV
jgi:hypothetical protein